MAQPARKIVRRIEVRQSQSFEALASWIGHVSSGPDNTREALGIIPGA